MSRGSKWLNLAAQKFHSYEPQHYTGSRYRVAPRKGGGGEGEGEGVMLAGGHGRRPRCLTRIGTLLRGPCAASMRHFTREPQSAWLSQEISVFVARSANPTREERKGREGVPGRRRVRGGFRGMAVGSVGGLVLESKRAVSCAVLHAVHVGKKFLKPKRDSLVLFLL